MPTRKMLSICGFVLTLCLVGVVFPPGSYTVARVDDFDEAKRLYESFISQAQDLKRLDPKQL